MQHGFWGKSLLDPVQRIAKNRGQYPHKAGAVHNIEHILEIFEILGVVQQNGKFENIRFDIVQFDDIPDLFDITFKNLWIKDMRTLVHNLIAALFHGVNNAIPVVVASLFKVAQAKKLRNGIFRKTVVVDQSGCQIEAFDNMAYDKPDMGELFTVVFNRESIGTFASASSHGHLLFRDKEIMPHIHDNSVSCVYHSTFQILTISDLTDWKPFSCNTCTYFSS